ncbi:hypothetical protein ABZ621_29720 [Streptomyces sp. NPDC007863]|uniref:hypothetical protein n=1 Tax=Streptomyces sp. NPDC007863 TaxID=3154894 RepID=UPI0033D4D020
MSWRWEYDPSEEQVIGGAPPAFVAEVEGRADELVRAAEALYLDGSLFQGGNPRSEHVRVTGGMFVFLLVPRHECGYVLQVTCL